jgi:diacylglycerol kinase family enzyme
MKTVQLIHNPGAGDEAHAKATLIHLLEAAGYTCRYSSTENDDWQNIDPQIDFIAIAGGDGTIRKVISSLLEKEQVVKKKPVALLPLGTANNIATSLNIKGEPADIVRGWNLNKTTTIDVGKLETLTEPAVFIESFGYGVFPCLMQEMEKQGKEDIDDKQEKMKAALQLMHHIAHTYPPQYCQLTVDGVDHSGKYIMAEVMNTRFIGPNLFLSPHGHPGDGTFEVVLIPGEDQQRFAAYIDSKLKDAEVVYSFKTIRAENVQINWGGTHVHVDDEQLELHAGTPVKVHIEKQALVFLI